MIQLHLQPLVVAEITHGRHGNVVNLAESVTHKLLLVVVSALQAVIVVGTILNEATREHAREKGHEEEKQHGKHLPEKNAQVLVISIALPPILPLLLSLVLLWPLHVSSTSGLVPEEHKVEEVLR